jgi:iron complex outermembrane recepter protein
MRGLGDFGASRAIAEIHAMTMKPIQRIRGSNLRMSVASKLCRGIGPMVVILGSLVIYGPFAQAQSAPDASTSARTGGSGDSLQEVIVTAEKRSEKLLDVPSSVTVMSSEQLLNLQVTSLSDLANYVPGLSIVSGGVPGWRNITIRGISSAGANAAVVGTYIDDLPFGASSQYGRGVYLGIDLNPADIEQIEVLKGPQGTLYGGNTEGGLIKYVLRQPDLEKLDVRVGGESSHIDNSGGLSGSARASVSLPVVDGHLAVLFSGSYVHNAGFIDNIGIGVNGSNQWSESAGRTAILWKLNDSFSVHATVLTQDVSQDDATAETVDPTTTQPVYGRLVTSTNFRQPIGQVTRDYSLGFDWNMGFATLTNSSAWETLHSTSSEDYSSYGFFCPPTSSYQGCPTYPYPDALALFALEDNMSKFVEEVRLTSPDSQRFQWLLGGYYTKEHPQEIENFPTYTAAGVPLPPVDNLLYNNSRYEFQESAAFANITYKFNDRFDIGGGDRLSILSQNACPGTYTGGLFPGGIQYNACTSLPSSTVTTWMANARYHIDQDQMLYTRVATGYRPGSGCPTCGIPGLTPGIVQPDRTTNYEVGYKAQLFDRRLQLDMSVFYIDWKHIQLTLESARGTFYPGNGGDATSAGFELAADYRILEGLELHLSASRTDAHLTSDEPGIDAVAGDRLPDSPLWSGALILDYQRPIDAGKSLLVGGTYQYRDNIYTGFGSGNAARAPIGTQNLAGAYAGISIHSLVVKLYGTNIFNNWSYTGGTGSAPNSGPQYIPVQPRTVGVSADYKW